MQPDNFLLMTFFHIIVISTQAYQSYAVVITKHTKRNNHEKISINGNPVSLSFFDIDRLRQEE